VPKSYLRPTEEGVKDMSYGEGEPKRPGEITCDVCDNTDEYMAAVYYAALTDSRIICRGCRDRLYEFAPWLKGKRLTVADEIELINLLDNTIEFFVKTREAKVTTHTARMLEVVQ
jgi:hypothetical protein